MKILSSKVKVLRWEMMTLLVLRVFVIVCALAALGSADPRDHAAGDAVSPSVTPDFRSDRHGYPFAAPPKIAFNYFSHRSHSNSKAPTVHGSSTLTFASPAPSVSPSRYVSSFKSPSIHVPKQINSVGSSDGNTYSLHHHGHHHHSKKQYVKSAMHPAHEISPSQSPSSSTSSQNSPMSTPSSTEWKLPIHSPSISPLSPSVKMIPPPSSTFVLPSPPPNQDCTAITCTEPMTYTTSGFPCGCVWPMQVRLQLDIALYTFFPLVSKLATDIASSLSLNQSQVRIMGANAANQQLDKTIVLVNLVPLQGKFKHAAAFSLYDKFWHKQVHVNPYFFGAYDVLDVHYPGLPPSPPSLSSNLAAIDDHPYPANYKGNSGSSLKPMGVDIPRTQNNGSGRSMGAVIIISAITAFLTCAGIAWIIITRRRFSAPHPEEALTTALSSFTKPSGGARSLAVGSKSLSSSLSFGSGMLNFTGSAKVFSLVDIENATDGFDTSRVLGEGGFGVVYRGIFSDGEQVAVKVLKRDKRDGIHEFLSEVEMLSRLHHKNLVKLLGICTEDHIRCLVYELVPNGSVEYHLHGVDKEVIAPLDWATRMKIALGAARGLAYLHEDSSPCVIHRDFKASNILLEHDFTPKVSDFGLARNALNEGNQPISTQVIGTFGYLAPEYAMTGHLLVKSDVYSYGVVLLELLTGRKPVDFTKPAGQENLVGWALPNLISKEGLEIVIDPFLKSSAPFDSFSKVAAIASMCVQPEVSRRPFMGEVVQALKLVCSELDDANEQGSGSDSNQPNDDNKSGQIPEDFQVFLGTHYSPLTYESSCDVKLPSPALDLANVSAEFPHSECQFSGRHCSSGPLGSGKKKSFWQRFGRFSRESMKEHLWPGTH
ncbi:receptor-like serine/threonine-protein kinase ALE2 isoform X2 [Spinacia oleracea]|uniref:Receptor-like serine/threonine-protein kinase ALE2 isoform X2 n=1 Tax=Spinacia oleracea TaxID=3562 RepID=A0A9R0IB92_SPIOL|nr:receptor-like serine/threonine-protein kinase ALE2 isoform X2 [Spinacia oleracea]